TQAEIAAHGSPCGWTCNSKADCDCVSRPRGFSRSGAWTCATIGPRSEPSRPDLRRPSPSSPRWSRASQTTGRHATTEHGGAGKARKHARGAPAHVRGSEVVDKRVLGRRKGSCGQTDRQQDGNCAGDGKV